MEENSEKAGQRRYAVSVLKDGVVKRDIYTGRIVSVQTENGTFRSGPLTQSAVSEASSKRHEALKRLADR